MGHALVDRALAAVARVTGFFAPWHKWPFIIAVAALAGIRVILRRSNLFDTDKAPSQPKPPAGDPFAQRTADGSFNCLAAPAMGMAGARFGRNFPIAETTGESPPALFEPSPRRISNALLARREFTPALHLNVLACGWVQFMVHDWLSHGENGRSDPYEVPIEVGDDWPQNPMTILRSARARANGAEPDAPATYRNIATHWWDGSQIYGSSLSRQMQIRSDPATGLLAPDGKIGLAEDGRLPIEKMRNQVADQDGAKFPDLELAGVNGNWWLGLSVMHTLFAREHNSIVDLLRREFPSADGEWLFQKARLVATALIAKIHTTEWTPSLMNSPTGRFVMRGNWWGLMGERYRRAFGRLSTWPEISGIPGSPTSLDGVPYAMTEEFTACYRMHSLLPDELSFRSHFDDREIARKSLLEMVHGGAARIYREIGFDDVVYSLATSNPGALVLHNYPNALRRLPEKPEKGLYADVAATDILRDRERGVPRYCRFRRLLGMPAPKSFDELTTNPQWREEVRAVYRNIEDVDLLIGTLCESQSQPGAPPGFAFSDTVFRIFVLMASRRLSSDRFYTSDFTPEVYTPAGFAWVENNSFKTVLRRHCAELAPLFASVENVFFPWERSSRAESSRESAGPQPTATRDWP